MKLVYGLQLHWFKMSLSSFRRNPFNLKRLFHSAWCTDVNRRGEDDVTPLHHAARYRREKNKKKETPSEPNPDEVYIRLCLINIMVK